jgi:hypothetical protein
MLYFALQVKIFGSAFFFTEMLQEVKIWGWPINIQNLKVVVFCQFFQRIIV